MSVLSRLDVRASMLAHLVLDDGPYQSHLAERVVLNEAFASADYKEGVQSSLKNARRNLKIDKIRLNFSFDYIHLKLAI
ncbi:MAG: hypothetical protein ABJG88_01560 [Litorimonas sp.]